MLIYTYISERWSTTSWLDRVVASNDFHSCIRKIDILYYVSDKDHIPIKVYVNSDCIPNITPVPAIVQQKLGGIV